MAPTNVTREKPQKDSPCHDRHTQVLPIVALHREDRHTTKDFHHERERSGGRQRVALCRTAGSAHCGLAGSQARLRASATSFWTPGV